MQLMRLDMSGADKWIVNLVLFGFAALEYSAGLFLTIKAIRMLLCHTRFGIKKVTDMR